MKATGLTIGRTWIGVCTIGMLLSLFAEGPYLAGLAFSLAGPGYVLARWAANEEARRPLAERAEIAPR